MPKGYKQTIERYVPAWARDQLWSKFYQPVGPQQGSNDKTHVQYRFASIGEMWTTKDVRIVACWMDETLSEPCFLNTVVNISAFISKDGVSCVEGYDGDDNFFRWAISGKNENTMVDCSLVPELIGEKVLVCEETFSLTLNQRVHFSSSDVQAMMAYNMDSAARRIANLNNEKCCLCTDETLADFGQETFERKRVLAQQAYVHGLGTCADEILRTPDPGETMDYILETFLLNRRAEQRV
jgi:hypothetical protein